jgi:hypothetical protein
MDYYIKWLTDIIDELERIFGLSVTLEGNKISELGMVEIADYVQKEISTKGRSIIEERNVASFNTIGFLAHLSMRMDFYGHMRLDLRNFPMKDKALVCLRSFTIEQKLTPKVKDSANIIATILDRIDKKHLDLRYSLGYRYLRIFIVLLLHSGYAHLSIVSKCLISQIERGNVNAGQDRQFYPSDRDISQTEPSHYSG